MKHNFNWYKKNSKEQFLNWWIVDRNEMKENLEMKKWWKQLPNLLSSVRLCAAPFLPILFLSNPPIGLILAAIVASTDCLDGFLARKLHAYSKFGAKLDTLADKAFALSSIISIATSLFLSSIKTSIFSLKSLLCLSLVGNTVLELKIGKINVDAFLEKKKTSSSILGKLKTWPLFGTILLSLLVDCQDIFTSLLTNLPISNVISFIKSPACVLSAISLSFVTLAMQVVCAKQYETQYNTRVVRNEIKDTTEKTDYQNEKQKTYVYHNENLITPEKTKVLTKKLNFHEKNF